MADGSDTGRGGGRQAHIERLQAENAALRAQVETLTIENQKLTFDCGALNELLFAETQRRQAADAEIARLRTPHE